MPFRIQCRCGAAYTLKARPSRDRVQCRKCGEPIRIPDEKPQRKKPQQKTAEPARQEPKRSGFPIIPAIVVLALLVGGGIVATQVDFEALLGEAGNGEATGPTGGGVPGFTEHSDALPEIADVGLRFLPPGTDRVLHLRVAQLAKQPIFAKLLEDPEFKRRVELTEQTTGLSRNDVEFLTIGHAEINLVGTFPDWRPYTIVIRTTSPHSLPKNGADGEAPPSEQIGDRVVFSLPNDLAMFVPDEKTIVLGTRGAVRVVAEAETSLPGFDWIRFSEFDFVKAPDLPSLRGEEGPTATAVSFGSKTEVLQTPVTQLLQMPSTDQARKLADLLDRADEENRERGVPILHSRKRFGAVLEQTGPDQMKANPHDLRLLAGRWLVDDYASSFQESLDRTLGVWRADRKSVGQPVNPIANPRSLHELGRADMASVLCDIAEEIDQAAAETPNSSSLESQIDGVAARLQWWGDRHSVPRIAGLIKKSASKRIRKEMFEALIQIIDPATIEALADLAQAGALDELRYEDDQVLEIVLPFYLKSGDEMTVDACRRFLEASPWDLDLD